MNCTHDPLYRKQNEQCGGVGCPICNSQRKRQYIDSARDVTPIKTMADKTVNAYNKWQAFIAKCNDTYSGSQWADRGADHE